MADFVYNSTDYDLTDCLSLPLRESYDNTDISSKSTDGYLATRPRFTRNTKIWELQYVYATETDKTTLESLEKLVHQHTAFTWNNPQDSTAYNVLLKEPIQYTLVQYNYWNISLTLIER